MSDARGIGDNVAPDYAQSVTDQMRRDYESLETTVDELLTEARALPATVDDDDTMGTVAKCIKRLRDTAARIEAFRIKEKEPYLRGGNAVDGFFGTLASKIMRAKRTDKAGAADVLQARVDDYTQRKLAAERERRRKEAEEQARIAAEKAAEAAKAARAAEDARLAAERARKPENVTAKTVVAEAAADAAVAAATEANLTAMAAEDAAMATFAKPADMVRTRVDDAMVTMATEPYAEVTDRDLLDRDKLWPFLTDDAIAKALRAWAKTTGHKAQMPGAMIGRRQKTMIR